MRSTEPVWDGVRGKSGRSVAAEYFADAACSEPVRLLAPGQGEPPDDLSMLYELDFESCGQLGKLAVIDVFPVLSPHAGTTYVDSGGSCQATDPDPAGAYRVGPSNAQELPALSTWVDPG